MPPRFFLAYDRRMDFFARMARTFGLIFLAELGDKTQLATLSLAVDKRARLPVFLGAALALVCTTLLAVLGGEAIARFVPEAYLRRLAGAAFLVLGALYLFKG
jgi:putative Ca2+/H+ antiporter (TMEM165/GDT1 family)